MRRALAGLAVLACMLGGCGGDDSVPTDFVGIVSEDVYAGADDYRESTLRAERAAGIRLIRQRFDWAEIERTPGEYDFSRLDGYVREAATVGIRMLPILFNPPPFHSSRPAEGARKGTYPPADPAAMARFAEAAVRRYGPDGSLWNEQPDAPKLPVHDWQVWNEPNLRPYWPSGPDAKEYLDLLRPVGRAIKRADPEAKVVTGGVPNSRLGQPMADYLTDLLAASGERPFDIVAIHPYGPDAAAAFDLVELARDVLDDAGAEDIELWVTEIGWASGGPDSPFTVGPRGQAERIHDFLTMAAERRDDVKLRGVVYYNWRDAPPHPGGVDFFGLYSGLLNRDGTPKPALAAFRDAAREIHSD